MREALVRQKELVLSPSVERRVQRLHAVDLLLNRMSAGVSRYLPTRRRALENRIDRIEELGAALRSLDDDGLAQIAHALRPALLRSDVAGPALNSAFAVIREVSHRRLGLRHHRVQLMGGLTMAAGGLAEMQTGEGKTVTALLPAISYALSGRPVHVVTVNEYLARRDAEQLRPVYESLGLTVGIVESGQSHDMRRRAYSADVTYCTNKDLVFDYLRDRTAMRSAAAGQKSHLLLRGLSFALVDEADSVLIDEAQTPLILAGERPSEGQLPVFRAALELASTLIPGRHFRIVGARRQIELESNGRSVLDGMAYRFEGAWRSPDAREELLCQALSAVHLYQKDRHYIVLDGKVQIVDEYTGRVMPDRSWQYGLHQMIETKEGLTPTNQRDTLAQITYQRFFRRYVRLAGMSGTLREVDGEMLAVYGLRTTSVPTHAPSRRRCIGTTILPTVDQKWQEVALAARREAEAGRAVLIGTRSVAASEAISGILGANGVDHVVLNARQDKAEADAIGNAGLPGRITVATNMAGRGTDIHLSAEVTTRGGLHVILTEYHESARIDRQLIGRAGRQGDPGTFEIIASLDDEIFARFAPLATQVARGLYPFVPSPVVVLAPRYLAQSAAERKGRRTRREIVRNDQELDRSFFFSNQLQ